MRKEEQIKLMNLVKGDKIYSLGDNKEYTFIEYDTSNVPKNNYRATMAWYPDKEIWTPKEYENILFRFTMVKIAGVKNSRFLNEFYLK